MRTLDLHLYGDLRNNVAGSVIAVDATFYRSITIAFRKYGARMHMGETSP